MGAENRRDDENQKKVECWACSKPLAKEYSLKCTHCQVFQKGWRRYLGIGLPALSLIVAIISTSAIAVPILVDTFRPNNSNIVVNYLQYKDLTFSIFVANTGKRDGVIRTVRLRLPKSALGLPDDSVLPIYALLPREGEDRTIMLLPGKGKILYLKKPLGKKPLRVRTQQWQENEETERAEIEIDIINFDGSFESKRILVRETAFHIIYDHDSQFKEQMTTKNLIN